jgi:hypothetical protein
MKFPHSDLVQQWPRERDSSLPFLRRLIDKAFGGNNIKPILAADSIL